MTTSITDLDVNELLRQAAVLRAEAEAKQDEAHRMETDAVNACATALIAHIHTEADKFGREKRRVIELVDERLQEWLA